MRLLHDSWRAVRSSRGVVYTMAIITAAISTATLTFSVVDALALRPLPFDRDFELVIIETVGMNGRRGNVAAFEADTLRTYSEFGVISLSRGPTETAIAGLVGPPVSRVTTEASLFAALRLQPALGRLLSADDERPGQVPVAVISHGFWMRAYGGDSNVLGQRLGTAPTAAQIVGVLPNGAIYPAGPGNCPDVWTPLTIPESERRPDAPAIQRNYRLIARLAEGISLDRAVLAAETATETLKKQRPDGYQNAVLGARSVREALIGSVRPALLLALWSVVALVALTSVNVANISLSTAMLRTRDLAIRAALGATRSRLVGGLIVEGLMIAFVASGMALAVAALMMGVVRNQLPASLALTDSIVVNGRVFGFAALSALVSAVMFGLLPALQASRHNLVQHLGEGRQQISHNPRLRRGFLTIQVAFVTGLAVLAGLAITSFVRVTNADLGFTREGLVAAPLSGVVGSVAEIEASVGALPGITAVSIISGGSAPLVGRGTSTTSIRALPELGATEAVTAEYRRVSRGYFATAGIQMLRGRTFDPSERFGQALIVDETAYRALGLNLEAVGATVILPGAVTPVPIVGIVSNVRAAGPEQPSGPQAYSPLGDLGGTLLVRADAPRAAARELRAMMVREWPQSLRGQSVSVLADSFDRLTEERRVSTVVMTAFAVLALLIGAAGVYGVISVDVQHRTSEFGIRSALGAGSTRIVRLVLYGSVTPILVGTAVGWTVAAVLANRGSSLLFQTSPLEPAVYLSVFLSVLIAALAAAAIPAHRAAAVDPVEALRNR